MTDHKNIHSRILYDVEGNILTDTNNKIINIFMPEFEDMMKKKELRLFRNSTMKSLCYRYFITSQQQLYKFWDDRSWGNTESPNKTYHVYVDDDVDRTTSEYKMYFQLSREI